MACAAFFPNLVCFLWRRGHVALPGGQLVLKRLRVAVGVAFLRDSWFVCLYVRALSFAPYSHFAYLLVGFIARCALGLTLLVAGLKTCCYYHSSPINGHDGATTHQRFSVGFAWLWAWDSPLLFRTPPGSFVFRHGARVPSPRHGLTLPYRRFVRPSTYAAPGSSDWFGAGLFPMTRARALACFNALPPCLPIFGLVATLPPSRIPSVLARAARTTPKPSRLTCDLPALQVAFAV